VRELLKHSPRFPAPGKYLLAKRWDRLAPADAPEVVVFFAPPDVLAGLFTLAGFEEAEPAGAVFAPFAAGCGTLVLYPFLEARAAKPRCVLGLFDVSARPYIEPERLSFAVPHVRFARMVANMDESFLITGSWEKVRRRIARAAAPTT